MFKRPRAKTQNSLSFFTPETTFRFSNTPTYRQQKIFPITNDRSSSNPTKNPKKFLKVYTKQIKKPVSPHKKQKLSIVKNLRTYLEQYGRIQQNPERKRIQTDGTETPIYKITKTEEEQRVQFTPNLLSQKYRNFNENHKNIQSCPRMKMNRIKLFSQGDKVKKF